MIVIVDFQLSNIGSVFNMMRSIGASGVISSDPNEISLAEKIILPGVGSFDRAMSNINELNLQSVLNERVIDAKVPVLGICLGMQILGEGSQEGKHKGLSWIPGQCKKFNFGDQSSKSVSERLRVPHMGWNYCKAAKQSLLLKDMPDEMRFYFVHSYFFEEGSPSDRLLSTKHGDFFTSAIEKDNIYGTQFHPEKSHKFGSRLMHNFINYCS